MNRLYCILISCFAFCSLAESKVIDFEHVPEPIRRTDYFGFVNLWHDLDTLAVGAQEIPVRLYFSSDPEQEPGLFGPGWSLRLFESKMIHFTRGKFRWDPPAGKSLFFDQALDEKTSRGGRIFLSADEVWRAVEDNRKNMIIRHTTKEDWWFEYRAGQLIRFSIGDAVNVVRLEYTRGKPYAVYVGQEGAPRVSFEYRGGDLLALRFPDNRRLVVEHGSGKWLASDGVTDLSRMRFKFLLGFKEQEKQATKFSYEVVAKEGVSRNRFTYEKDGESRFVEWDPKTGYIQEDEGGIYTVRNDSYIEPKEAAKEEPWSRPIHPQSAKLEYTPHDGGMGDLWSYNWRTGERIRKNPKTGNLERKVNILARGPAYLKTRTREVRDGGKWKLVQRNMYDPEGRIIRRWTPDALFEWSWVLKDNGVLERTEFKNNTLTRRFLYKDDKLIETFGYGDDGVRGFQFAYDKNGDRRTRHFLNGEFLRESVVSSKTGYAIADIYPDGRVQLYSFKGKGRSKLVSEPGNALYVEIYEKGKYLERVKEVSFIQQWMLENDFKEELKELLFFNVTK